jgi:hypothetical protein
MTEWQIEIVIFATGKTIQFVVTAENLNKAKLAAVREFRNIAPGRKNLYLEARGDRTYTMVSDLYDIGSLCIECVSQAVY